MFVPSLIIRESIVDPASTVPDISEVVTSAALMISSPPDILVSGVASISSVISTVFDVVVSIVTVCVVIVTLPALSLASIVSVCSPSFNALSSSTVTL